jgi:hypothetical protein
MIGAEDNRLYIIIAKAVLFYKEIAPSFVRLFYLFLFPWPKPAENTKIEVS